MLENHLIITIFQGSCVRYACHLCFGMALRRRKTNEANRFDRGVWQEVGT